MARRGQQSGGGGLLSGLGRGISSYMSEPDPPPRTPTHGRSAEEPLPIPGLPELIEMLNIMGAAPPGVRPQINPELLEKIKNTPMHPVLKALQPVYKKLGSPENAAEQPQRTDANTGPPPGPGPSSAQPPPSAVTPNAAELENIEAGLKTVSSKLDAVSQGVADVAKQSTISASFQTLEGRILHADSETREAVKASANASKTQFETVDTKVSQMTGKLDPALAELKQGIKKLENGLLGDVRNERARLEAKVTELQNEVKDLQQVIDATRTELLPVEIASKMTLQGTFTDEVEKASNRARPGTDNAAGNVAQTAKRVRTNMQGLITKCRALFASINRDPQAGSNPPDLGTEGEWGRCADHLRASDARLRSAVEEKEESAQQLQFVGFVVDQIRKGHYTEKEWKSDHNGKNFVALLEKSPNGFANIQLLAQDLSRLTATAMAAQTTPAVPANIVAPTATHISTPAPGTPKATPAPPTVSKATAGAPAANQTTTGASSGPRTTVDAQAASKAAKGASATSRNATAGATATTNTATPSPNTTESANTSSANNAATQPKQTARGSRGLQTRGTPITNQPTTTTASNTADAAPLTPPATAGLKASNAVTTPLASPATGGHKASNASTTADATAILTPPATAGLKGSRVTSKLGSKAPATPVTPRTPSPPVEATERSHTPVVTAPSSPAAEPVPIPASPRQEADISPKPTKKRWSYSKSKSDFIQRPLSGWGPLAV